MDPMKPVCEEPNEIMPSLKEILQKDIDALDEYFGKITENTKENRNAMDSWSTVREAAISFAETFDKIKTLNSTL